MNEPTFPCDSCGECCRHVDRVPQLAAYDDGTGKCVHLRGNLCEIYASRPEICNVEVMYQKYFAKDYSREEFFAMNQRACAELKALRARPG